MSNVSLKDILTGVQSTVFKNKRTFTLYTTCLVLTNEMAQKGHLWPEAAKINFKNLKTKLSLDDLMQATI